MATRKPTGGRGSNQYQTQGTSTAAARSTGVAGILGALQDQDPGYGGPIVVAGECPITFKNGKWVKPRCGHSSCKDALRRVRSFSDTVDSLSAAQWVNAGVEKKKDIRLWEQNFEPNEARPWIKAGFLPFEAATAFHEGLGIEEASEWKAAINHLSELNGFVELDITKEEAAPWRPFKMRAGHIDTVLRAGLTPESYTAFMNASGIGPENEWSQSNAVDYVHYQDPELAARWYRTRIRSHDQIAWHEKGWSPEDASAWDDVGVGCEDADRLRVQGVTPQQLVEMSRATLSATREGAVTWGSHDQVNDWARVIHETGLDVAQQWSGLGLDSSVVVGAVRWGITPEEVQGLLSEGTKSVDVDGLTVTARWANGRTRWLVTGPDGVDMEAEKVAAAFTGQRPAWDRLRSDAQRFAKVAVTPGHALQWAASHPGGELGDLRQAAREYPLGYVLSQATNPNLSRRQRRAVGEEVLRLISGRA